MSISTRASDVRSRRPQAKIGQPAESSYLDAIRTLINSDPQAAQVSQIVVDNAVATTDYTVTIDTVEITVTSDAGPTLDEIAAALALAINGEALVRGQVSAVSDGVDTVTLTGTYPGVSFDLSDSDPNLTTSDISAAASAASIAFGRLVVSGGYQSDEANELGILAASGAFDAQVDNLVVTYAAGEIYTVSIAVADESYEVSVDADTDTDTTGAAIVAALNAILPASTVLAAYNAGTNTISLTAEVAGQPFVAGRGLTSGTIARLTLVHVTSGDSTSLDALAVGVSIYTTDEENVTVEGDDVVYPANAGVQVLSKGLIWVSSAETPAKGDPVYIELGVPSDNGKFFVASSATRVRLHGATWERSARSSSGDDLAVVRISL